MRFIGNDKRIHGLGDRQACDRTVVTQSMGRPGSSAGQRGHGAPALHLEFELRRADHFANKAAARC
jgi:hypothetical protein